MARKVTRTIKSTHVVALALNMLTQTPEEVEIDVPGVYETEKEQKKLMENVRKRVETDELKVAAIKVASVVEELREMSEDDFIKYSVPSVSTKNESEEN